MRYSSRGPLLFIGCFLLTHALVSPLRAENAAATLTFLTPAPPQPAAQPSFNPPTQPEPSAPPQPAPVHQPTTAAPAHAYPRVGATSLAYAQQPFVEPQVTSQTRQALNFYGGYSARATLSQLPRRTPLAYSAPQPLRRPVKPFENVQNEPTVSPYMNLFREEEELESAPNYFAFVRPQMEQLDANRIQQRELQQLRGQLNNVSGTVVGPRYEPAGPSGTAARYMDTAQFYGGWRR